MIFLAVQKPQQKSQNVFRGTPFALISTHEDDVDETGQDLTQLESKKRDNNIGNYYNVGIGKGKMSRRNRRSKNKSICR